jgi:hypothetical protein
VDSALANAIPISPGNGEKMTTVRPSKIQRPAARPGEHTEEALREWGSKASELERLRSAGAIGVRDTEAKAAAGR